MAKKQKKTPEQMRPRGLGAALAALQENVGKSPLFSPSTRRYIPMRHRSLGMLLAGEIHPGLPTGTVIEVLGQAASGKSSLTMALAEAIINQAADAKQPVWTEKGIELIPAPRRVLFNDFEQTFDETYLRSAVRGAVMAEVSPRTGKIINLKEANVFVHRPGTLEEGLEVLLAMVESGEFGMVVLDSVAAMLSYDEKVAKMNESTVGFTARAMNKLFRKTIPSLRMHGTVMVIVNQWRDKIGVCFNWSARVHLADGTTRRISEIVRKRQRVKVLSYNPATGAIEPRMVTQWHENGRAEKFLHLVFEGGKNGKRQMVVTPNHAIYTPAGTVQAGSLRIGDRVMVRDVHWLTPDQHDVVLGSVLGDGSLRFESATRGYLRVGHGPAQAAYCRWKASVFGAKVSMSKAGVTSFATKPSVEFTEYRGLGKQKRSGGRDFVPQWAIDRITPAVAAIWFMDDGTHSGSFAKWGEGRYSISAKRLTFHSLSQLAAHFSRIGMGQPRPVEGKGLFWTGGSESAKFCRAVAPYIHPSMRYKIKQPGAPAFSWVPAKAASRDVLIEARLVSLRAVATSGLRNREASRFDIGVDRNHNYFVDGVLVSNSYGDPRTTPGGKATEYFDSVRIDCSGSHKTPWFPESGKIVNVKTMKNKVTGRKGEVAQYHLGSGLGLSPEAELLEAMEVAGLAVIKRGVEIKAGNGRKFASVPECFAWLHGIDDVLFDKLWAICAKKGHGPSLAQEAQGWEVE